MFSALALEGLRGPVRAVCLLPQTKPRRASRAWSQLPPRPSPAVTRPLIFLSTPTRPALNGFWTAAAAAPTAQVTRGRHLAETELLQLAARAAVRTDKTANVTIFHSM